MGDVKGVIVTLWGCVYYVHLPNNAVLIPAVSFMSIIP